MTEIDWIGGTDNWSGNPPTDWSTGTQPGPTDDVVINVGAPMITADAGTVRSLIDNSGLLIETGGTLIVTSTFTNSGVLALDDQNNAGGSSLTVGGALNNTGTINVDTSIYGGSAGGTTFAVTGKLTNQGTLNIGAGDLQGAETVTFGNLDITGGTLSIVGSYITGSAGKVTVKAGAAVAPTTLASSLTVLDAAELDFGSGTITGIGSTGSLTMHGIAQIDVSGGSGANSALALTSNAGSLALDYGVALTDAGTFTNSGVLALDDQNNAGGSSLTVGGALNNTGTINVDTSIYGGSAGGTTFAVTGKLTNQGTLNIGAGDLQGAETVTFGNLDITGGTLSIVGSYITGSAGKVTVKAGAAVAPTTLASSLTVLDAAELDFGSGTITGIGSTGSLTMHGIAQIDVSGGSGANSALALTSNAGSLALDYGVALTDAGTFTNSGVLALDDQNNAGGSSLTVGGALNNTGTINVDTSIYGGSAGGTTFAVTGKLTNQGTLNIGAGDLQGAETVTFGGLANAGNIAIVGSSMVSASLTVNGTASNSDAATVTVDSGTLAFSGNGNSFTGTIGGSGTLAFVGNGSSTLKSGLTLSIASMGLSNTAMLTLGANLTYGGLYSQTGGTLSVAGFAMTIAGSANFAGTSAVAGPGTLVTKGSTNVTALTLGGGVTLTNTGTMTEVGNLTLANATLTNTAVGTFDLAGDVGLTTGSGSPLFTNAGTLAKTSGTGISHVAVAVNDTGTLSVASGHLEFDGGSNSFSGRYVGSGMVDFGAATTDKLGTVSISTGACLTNYGSVSQSGTVTVSDGSTVANVAGATWNFTGNIGILLASGSTSPLFTNAGALSKTSGGTGTTTIGIDVVDTGTISAATGNLAFNGATTAISGTIDGAGTVSFGGGGAISFNSGTSITSSGWTITGADTTATIGTALTYAMAFSETAGASLVLVKALTLDGSVAFSRATISGVAALSTGGATALGSLTVSGSVAWGNTGTITANGALTLGDASGKKTILTNAAGATYDITGTAGITLGGGTASLLANAGLLEKTGSTGVSRINVRVVDTGSVMVTTGTLEFDGAASSFAGGITGSGTVAIGAGATLLQGASLSVAELSLVAGGRLALSGALSYAGTLTENAGTSLSLGTTTLTLTGTETLAGAMTGAGTLAIVGGKAAINSGAKLLAATVSISGGALVTLGTSIQSSSALTASASTFDLAGHTLTLVNGAKLVSGTINGAGALLLYGVSTLSQGVSFDGAVALTNSGTLTETGGLMLGDPSGGSATVVNKAGATFSINDDTGIAIVSGGSGRVTNAGTMVKAEGNGTSVIAAALSNTGTIESASGTLDVAGAITGTGKLLIDAGAVLELGSSSARTNAAEFLGAGTLQLDNASAFAGSVTGFGTGDKLDLRSLSFGAGTTVHFTDTSQSNNASGTLTVSDGGHTAKIALLGSYTLSNFVATADSASGTAITFANHAG